MRKLLQTCHGRANISDRMAYRIKSSLIVGENGEYSCEKDTIRRWRENLKQILK